MSSSTGLNSGKVPVLPIPVYTEARLLKSRPACSYLVITRTTPSNALENFILERCQEDSHIAVIVSLALFHTASKVCLRISRFPLHRHSGIYKHRCQNSHNHRARNSLAHVDAS